MLDQGVEAPNGSRYYASSEGFVVSVWHRHPSSASKRKPPRLGASQTGPDLVGLVCLQLVATVALVVSTLSAAQSSPKSTTPRPVIEPKKSYPHSG